MTTPALDVQKKLDDWLASSPSAQKYVTKLWYISDGAPIPADVTHLIRLSSMASQERDLRIGLVAKPEYAVFLDTLLALIATQPPQ